MQLVGTEANTLFTICVMIHMFFLPCTECDIGIKLGLEDEGKISLDNELVDLQLYIR